MKKDYFEDDDKKPEPTWPAIRDLFAMIIVRAKGWDDAAIIAEAADMARHFLAAYPGVSLSLEDLRLALYDLQVPYERNEHNDKFYYLANWK